MRSEKMQEMIKCLFFYTIGYVSTEKSCILHRNLATRQNYFNIYCIYHAATFNTRWRIECRQHGCLPFKWRILVDRNKQLQVYRRREFDSTFNFHDLFICTHSLMFNKPKRNNLRLGCVFNFVLVWISLCLISSTSFF